MKALKAFCKKVNYPISDGKRINKWDVRVLMEHRGMIRWFAFAFSDSKREPTPEMVKKRINEVKEKILKKMMVSIAMPTQEEVRKIKLLTSRK